MISMDMFHRQEMMFRGGKRLVPSSDGVPRNLPRVNRQFPEENCDWEYHLVMTNIAMEKSQP